MLDTTAPFWGGVNDSVYPSKEGARALTLTRFPRMKSFGVKCLLLSEDGRNKSSHSDVISEDQNVIVDTIVDTNR